MTKNIITAVALVAATLVSANAFAQVKEGPWMVRVRAVSLQSANSDSTGLSLNVNDKVIPEVDFSYFYNKNFALELILTVPQTHDLKAGADKLGTVSHLPPTLLAQYHFALAGFKPYVGAGVNYTRFTSVSLPLGVDIARNSFGGALQVGVDIPLSAGMYLNLDVKKAYIGTDVSIDGKKMGTFKVDPVLIGVGVGWRF